MTDCNCGIWIAAPSKDAIIELLGDQMYYPPIVRMLKPNPDIYGYVLEQADQKPAETLFLDDNLLNIRAAAALGIRAVQVVSPKTILDYLDGIGE